MIAALPYERHCILISYKICDNMNTIKVERNQCLKAEKCLLPLANNPISKLPCLIKIYGRKFT